MATADVRLREYLERQYADAVCAAADALPPLPFQRRTSRVLAGRQSLGR